MFLEEIVNGSSNPDAGFDGKSRPQSILVLANQIREFGSSLLTRHC